MKRYYVNVLLLQCVDA